MKEIKVEVEFTEGFEKRYTKACLEVLEKRKSDKRENKSVANRLQKSIS